MEFDFERQSEEYKELKSRILDILEQVKDERKDLEHEKQSMQVGRSFLFQNSTLATEFYFKSLCDLRSIYSVFKTD